MARPLKKPEPGKSITIGVRVAAELRTDLETQAALHDRNLTQECERRLRRSLEVETLLADAFERIRAEKGLWATVPYMELTLREAYGGAIGVEAKDYADLATWEEQPARRALGKAGMETLGRLKARLRKIEARLRGDEIVISKLPKRE